MLSNAVPPVRQASRVAVPLMTDVPAETALDAPAATSTGNAASLARFAAGEGSHRQRLGRDIRHKPGGHGAAPPDPAAGPAADGSCSPPNRRRLRVT